MGIPEIQAESLRLVKQWTAERKAILDRNEEWRRRWEKLGEDTPADRMPAELFKIHEPVACSYDPKVMLCGECHEVFPAWMEEEPEQRVWPCPTARAIVGFLVPAWVFE